MQWLELCPNPKTAEVANMFRCMEGVRYDTIRPEMTGHADGREQWVLNTSVALLLGEKDLELGRCKLARCVCGRCWRRDVKVDTCF
jgi:hypothetical protein